MKESNDLVEELQSALKEILEDRPTIIAVYLFGSYAIEKARVVSDLDLGFLLDERTYRIDPFGAGANAYVAAMHVGMRFGLDTDVTILNSSSVEMAYEVVTTGRCVYTRDEDRRLEYETTIRGMFYDFQPFLLEVRARFLAHL